MRRAQGALEQGDYPLAKAASEHALRSYPTSPTANRALGEACLEQGDVDGAIEQFGRTLSLDPLNLVARLGMGVACEERNDLRSAYDHYLAAWDLNPTLGQLRDELVRLRTSLGISGRLHLTRAGLGAVYARGGQFGRAVAELRAVTEAEPNEARAPMALGEVLWRQGDDTGASAICHETLQRWPENVRALAILAEIGHRRRVPTAREASDAYLAVDPAADVASQLADLKPGSDWSFAIRSAPLPEFIYEPVAVVAPAAPVRVVTGALPPNHMPVPDLWDNLVRDLGGAEDGAEEELSPFDWGGEGARESPLAVELEPVLDLPPVNDFTAPDDGLIDPSPHLGGPVVAPIADIADLLAAAGPNDLAHDFSALDLVGPESANGFESLAVEALGEPLGRVSQDDLPPPSSSNFGFAADPGAEFLTAEGGVDLTVGWDDLDRMLSEATPAAPAAVGDDLLQSYGLPDLAPFDVGGGEVEPSIWEPFSADEFGETAAVAPVAADVPAMAPLPAPLVAIDLLPSPSGGTVDPMPKMVDIDLLFGVSNAPDLPAQEQAGSRADVERGQLIATINATTIGVNPSESRLPTQGGPFAAPPVADHSAEAAAEAEQSPLAALTGNWDEIDAELDAAIPAPPASGYTVLLRNIDQEGIMPFHEVSGTKPEDHLLHPDGSGAPLDFDDLLTVTSQDGTAALALAAEARDLGLSDIEPFSFSDAIGQRTPEIAEHFSDIDLDRAAIGVAAVTDSASFNGSGLGVAEAATAAATPVSPPETEKIAGDIDVGGSASLETRTPQADQSVSSWPAHIGGTSALIDRTRLGTDLFGRMRDGKRALVQAGLLVVDRTVSREPQGHLTVAAQIGPETASVESQVVATALPTEPTGKAAVPPEAVAIDTGTLHGLDLVALRGRVKLGPASARDVVAEIEAAMAAGYPEPLMSRVLGEAFMSLGRGDQAMAHFRHAMTLRTRRR